MVLTRASDAFSRLIVDGVASENWEYVRDVHPEYYGGSTFHPENSKVNPQLGRPDLQPTNANFTCGRLAFESAATTKTAVIPAGADVGFGIHLAGSDHYQPDATIWHRGPGFIWLARAPNDDLENFSGFDGEWFKIDWIGPANDTHWKSHRATEVWFSIPEAVPPGKYLLRIEHVWIMPSHFATFMNQWYINCAHVEITGNGNGVPPPGVRHPGHYTLTTPGAYIRVLVLIFANLFRLLGTWAEGMQADQMEPSGLLDYVQPDPLPWRG